MAKKKPHQELPEYKQDVLEFGIEIADLIWAWRKPEQEARRASYREERRAFMVEMAGILGKPAVSYREYLKLSEDE